MIAKSLLISCCFFAVFMGCVSTKYLEAERERRFIQGYKMGYDLARDACVKTLKTECDLPRDEKGRFKKRGK